MSLWSNVRGFLTRHKRAEEEIATAAGIAGGRVLLKYLFGAGVAAAAIAVPALMIDLSNNNGPGAAAAIAQPGVKAVEAKATEGLGFQDSVYPTFRAAALKYHKPFGGYLFLHPDESGKAQADYFLAYARPRRGDLQPVVDSEMGSPCSAAPATLAALNELKAKGFKPVLYSNTYWLTNLKTCAPALEAFPVWQAEYGPVLHTVAGFKTIAWQYTDNSGVAGLRVDGSHLLVPVSSLVIGKPLTPAQVKAAKLAHRKAVLRAIQGRYFPWYTWRHALGRWKGLTPADRDARPSVRPHVPLRWWERNARQWHG